MCDCCSLRVRVCIVGVVEIIYSIFCLMYYGAIASRIQQDNVWNILSITLVLIYHCCFLLLGFLLLVGVSKSWLSLLKFYLMSKLVGLALSMIVELVVGSRGFFIIFLTAALSVYMASVVMCYMYEMKGVSVNQINSTAEYSGQLRSMVTGTTSVDDL